VIILTLEITLNNLFKYKKSESSPQNSFRISCQSVLIPRKISGTLLREISQKYMKFEVNNEKFEGKFRETYSKTYSYITILYEYYKQESFKYIWKFLFCKIKT
jgi:hypothetical protein